MNIYQKCIIQHQNYISEDITFEYAKYLWSLNDIKEEIIKYCEIMKKYVKKYRRFSKRKIKKNKQIYKKIDLVIV